MAGLIVRWSAAIALAFCLAAPGLAATYKAPAQQVRDERVVRSALEAAAKGGLPALGRHVRRLEAVLSHAPPTFPIQEMRDGAVITRAMDGQEAMSRTLLGLMAAASQGQSATALRELNTYPMAAQLLGSHAVAMRRPEAALAPLDKGLALQPENGGLVSEKATALYQLGRTEEALALLDGWLGMKRRVARADQARILRAKGFGLINLRRLDEAEAAYREALAVEPNHALTNNQLQYIAELRAGGLPRDPALTTADQAPTAPPLP